MAVQDGIIKLKTKYKIAVVCLIVLLVVSYLNRQYEVIAINPFYCKEGHALKVLTWNVHCSEGADKDRQRKIAELILQENADFVLLNEYNQDSCLVVDSLLKAKYPFTEEYQSHRKCGDIFYSKRSMTNSGHVFIPIQGKSIQTIKATIAVKDDSVQLFGVHMASNRYAESNDVGVDRFDSNYKSAYRRYIEARLSRCFQADWTKKEVLKSEHPVIVMGDMNDFNKSQPLMTLRSCGLQESWWEGGNGYGTTYHDGWMRLRIDHILHSDRLKLQSIKVIETDLSDHNPVVAGFSVNK